MHASQVAITVVLLTYKSNKVDKKRLERAFDQALGAE